MMPHGPGGTDTHGARVWVNSSHFHEYLISKEFSGAIMYGRDDIYRNNVLSHFQCYPNIPQTLIIILSSAVNLLLTCAVECCH